MKEQKCSLKKSRKQVKSKAKETSLNIRDKLLMNMKTTETEGQPRKSNLNAICELNLYKLLTVLIGLENLFLADLSTKGCLIVVA